MATTLVLNPLTPPPDTCIPGTAAELVAFMAQYLQIVQKSATLTSTTVMYGSSTPDVSDQDKPWERTTPAGVGLGTYLFVNGKWTRTAPFPKGTTASYRGPSSNFDNTGKGIAGTETEGWLLCNGNNSTIDLRNKFIAGGSTYIASALGVPINSWQSSVDPSNPNVVTGGRSQVTIQVGNLPLLSADFGAATDPGNSTQSFVRGNGPSGANIVDTITPGTNNPLNVVPPFYALAFIEWNPNI